ncbi:MAG: FHIPEP family type III secretion protein [Planctomycetes bacterium]|nr:FHIPEP family type III secretion protein [Planctomycetota bacterium]
MAGASLGLVLPVLMILSLLVVVVPVSPLVLDLLLAANLTGAVILLLATLFVAKPLEFSAFPSLLLLSTLARLVLNIASTRLVLTRAASQGTSAAGEVIHSFARFVAQDQLVVGMILFAILVVIQFMVVTKGATRLSEVAARFALDGLPGRQMAIDADLNTGAITADEARRRRADVAAQADFHAAMDGAGKFVRGDALAGILITLVNLIGGVLIGVIQYRMAPQRAVEVFSLLTIGDGLVTQIPSFLIGLSAALLATRSSSETNLSRDVIGQTFQDPAVLFLASAATLALAFTGLPMLPMLILGTGCAITGESLRRRRLQTDLEQVQTAATAAVPAKPVARPEDQLTVEPIELELGFRLIRLTHAANGGGLMERVTQLRQRIAQELGILLPKVKIRDSLKLKDRAYQIKLRGVIVAGGEVRPEELLALDTGLTSGTVSGTDAQDPVTGHPGRWIEAGQAERARTLGYKIVEPTQIVIGHLADVVRGHADELLSRQHVHQLLDNLRQSSPRVIDELIPELLKPSQVHQVLANLLRERIPVRDLETILATLGDHADRTKDTLILTEYVRQALSRVICQPVRDTRGVIHAITVDPALEDVLANGFEFSERGPIIKLTPQVTDGVCHELARQIQKLTRAGLPAVVVCGPRVRHVLRQITVGPLPKVTILSLNEIPRETSVRSVAQIPLNAVKIPLSLDAGWRRSPNTQPDELVASH